MHRSLIPEAMNKKLKHGKTEIAVYFFNSNKRLVFPKMELNKKFALDHKNDTKK